jgi:HSP20 family protein
MSLIRLEPFGGLGELFGRSFPSRSLWPHWALEESAGHAPEWRPSADISETDKEYLIRAELPAVKKEDVKVTVENGVITIQGERKQDKEEKTEKYHRVESVRGSFTRSFSLPENVSAEAIRCDSRDGVLTVRIPKAQPSVREPRQIPVE